MLSTKQCSRRTNIRIYDQTFSLEKVAVVGVNAKWKWWGDRWSNVKFRVVSDRVVCDGCDLRRDDKNASQENNAWGVMLCDRPLNIEKNKFLTLFLNAKYEWKWLVCCLNNLFSGSILQKKTPKIKLLISCKNNVIRDFHIANFRLQNYLMFIGFTTNQWKRLTIKNMEEQWGKRSRLD
jgi:hypothetical protein